MAVQKDTRVLQQLIRTTPQRADALLRAVATEIVGDIVQSFGTSPSPAGGPPGVDTGALRASMAWTPDPAAAHRLFVHDGVVYGVWLELGTERMAARPFVAPVFEEWRQRKFADFARKFGVFS